MLPRPLDEGIFAPRRRSSSPEAHPVTGIRFFSSPFLPHLSLSFVKDSRTTQGELLKTADDKTFFPSFFFFFSLSRLENLQGRTEDLDRGLVSREDVREGRLAQTGTAHAHALPLGYATREGRPSPGGSQGLDPRQPRSGILATERNSLPGALSIARTSLLLSTLKTLPNPTSYLGFSQFFRKE